MRELGRLLLAGFTVIAVAAVVAKFVAATGATDAVVGGAFGLSVVGLIVYFIPAIIAHTRNNIQSKAIFVLNLLLGWTALGWIAALVWAFTNSTVIVRDSMAHPGRRAFKRCPRCAEDVRAEAVICRYCQYEFQEPVASSFLSDALPLAASTAGGDPLYDRPRAGGLGYLASVGVALSAILVIGGAIGWLVYGSWQKSDRIQAQRAARPSVSGPAQNLVVVPRALEPDVAAPAVPTDASPLRQWTGAISAAIHGRMNPSSVAGTAGGRATVRFTVTRDGEVKDVTIAQSSGDDRIDNAALAAVHGSLPAAPAGVSQPSLSVSMPLTYRVR